MKDKELNQNTETEKGDLKYDLPADDHVILSKSDAIRILDNVFKECGVVYEKDLNSFFDSD